MDCIENGMHGTNVGLQRTQKYFATLRTIVGKIFKHIHIAPNRMKLKYVIQMYRSMFHALGCTKGLYIMRYA